MHKYQFLNTYSPYLPYDNAYSISNNHCHGDNNHISDNSPFNVHAGNKRHKKRYKHNDRPAYDDRNQNTFRANQHRQYGDHGANQIKNADQYGIAHSAVMFMSFLGRFIKKLAFSSFRHFDFFFGTGSHKNSGSHRNRSRHSDSKSRYQHRAGIGKSGEEPAHRSQNFNQTVVQPKKYISYFFRINAPLYKTGDHNIFMPQLIIEYFTHRLPKRLVFVLIPYHQILPCAINFY